MELADLLQDFLTRLGSRVSMHVSPRGHGKDDLPLHQFRQDSLQAVAGDLAAEGDRALGGGQRFGAADAVFDEAAFVQNGFGPVLQVLISFGFTRFDPFFDGLDDDSTADGPHGRGRSQEEVVARPGHDGHFGLDLNQGCPYVGVAVQLPPQHRLPRGGQSHFRCAKIGTVPGLHGTVPGLHLMAFDGIEHGGHFGRARVKLHFRAAFQHQLFARQKPERTEEPPLRREVAGDVSVSPRWIA